MTIGLLVVWLTALVLDRWWGELRLCHPLVFFGRCASWLERRLNPLSSRGSSGLLLSGALAVSRSGVYDALPDRQSVDRFLAETAAS